MLLMLFGIATLPRLLHPPKADPPRVVTESGIVRLVMLLHP